MIRTRIITLCMALPLLLAACAPAGGAGTPPPSTTDANAPARFSQEENTIAGLTIGVSTQEDVIAKHGQPESDATNTDEKFKLENRYLNYDGFICSFVKDAKGKYLLTQFTINRDLGLECPRGIQIGMTTEALEALFPQETTQESSAMSGSTIEYLYVERVQKAAKDGPDRMHPPFGYKAYAPEDQANASYTFMSAYDWPLMKPKREGRPGVLLQVNCKDGKVAEITLCAAPIVGS